MPSSEAMARTGHVKRALAALAVLALVLVATACGGSDEKQAGTSTTGGDVAGSLKLWFLSDPAYDQRWWDGMIAAFRSRYPDVDFQVTKLETVPLKQKTIAAFASGDEPDVFFSNGGEELNNLVRKRLARPLDDLVDLSAYNPTLVDAFRSTDGRAYGVPVGFGAPFALWYDRALFDRLGIQPPSDWDGLLSLCRTIRADGKVPISLGNAEQWPIVLWFDAFAYQYGGTQIRQQATAGTDGVTWSDPALVKAAERVKELVDAGCFPDGFNGLTYSQQTDLWLRGDAAMTLLGEWAVPTARDGAPRGFELDYFLVPDVPDAENSTAENEGMEAVPTALAVSAHSDNEPAVAAFVDFYGAFLKRQQQTTGRLSVASDPAPPSDPLQKRMLADASATGELYTPGDALLPSGLVDDLYQGLQQVTLGDITPEQFGEQMTTAAGQQTGQ